MTSVMRRVSRAQEVAAEYELQQTLEKVFGKTSFRPLQKEIILEALKGKDVYVQAATSFGKSLCYQLPAVVDGGVTIVVSPLLALMGNQVAALHASGIAVATINSISRRSDREIVIKDVSSKHPRTRLLYVTPELILTDSFRETLHLVYNLGNLSRIAIDEAHCISEWGHEFRPAYQQLGFFRNSFPRVPIICLTATATKDVRMDIMQTMEMHSSNTAIFTTSTMRENLHYHIGFSSEEKDTRLPWLLDFLKSSDERRKTDVQRSKEILDAPMAGIVYVSTRSDCDVLAARLRQHGIGAAPYHAGLSTAERGDCQENWIKNAPGFSIIVATTAFGMGIDKHDVRFVVHWNIPKSFEGFYQEAGRAGRDGKAALCKLFYSREDRDRVCQRIMLSASTSRGDHGVGSISKGQADKNRAASFQALVKYCEQVEQCRHRRISEFFGEQGTPNCDRACDICFQRTSEKSPQERRDTALSCEEWVSTQRQRGDLDIDEYE